MDIIAITEAIETLQNSDTTVENVNELASLYIVKEHLQTRLETEIDREYDDILPAYKKYVEIKRRYQLKEVTEGAVIKALNVLCQEIQEFLHIIYIHTDMNRERKILLTLFEQIPCKYKEK